MPGYFKNVPAGRGIFACSIIELRPDGNPLTCLLKVNPGF
jgi:hypothetical protein